MYLDGEEISEVAPKEPECRYGFPIVCSFSKYDGFSKTLPLVYPLKRWLRKEIKENVMDALKLVNLEDKD